MNPHSCISSKFAGYPSAGSSPSADMCIPPSNSQHWKSLGFAGNSCCCCQHLVEIVDVPHPKPYSTSCPSTNISTELAASSSTNMGELDSAHGRHPLQCPVAQAEVAPVTPRAATSSTKPNSKIGHGLTTLAIRNLPPGFTKEVLLQKWPPDGTYDFLYLPFSRKQRRTAGYAFINFVSHEAASFFCSQWDHKQLDEKYGAKARLNITAAEVQGLGENVRRLLACNVERTRNWQYLPSVFNGVQELPFTELLNNFAGRQYE